VSVHARERERERERACVEQRKIFALGCVYYYILTRGKHPFGLPYEREANILRGQYL
jgi:serine/threonine-protein kinase/endoribonuclease IRE1